MKFKINNIIYIILLSTSLNSLFSLPIKNDSFTNPVAEDGADPWIIKHDENYYYCYSEDNTIYVNASIYIEEAVQMTGKAIWKPEPHQKYSHEIWAPELHLIDNKWYIYFAADDGKNENHRMYVLEGKSADPQSPFLFKGKISSPSDKWAIDGTVLKYNKKLYFIWSGWEGDVNIQQNLYIAEMGNPWTIIGERVLISNPEYVWEIVGNPLINEGPEVLRNKEKIFIIYSASGSWTDNYCLGMLSLVSNNPLDDDAWVKHPAPVFSGTATVISPGHASFTKSPDESEDWIIYHSAKYKGAAWDRSIRMQKFSWTEEGNPGFGYPIANGVPINSPSK